VSVEGGGKSNTLIWVLVAAVVLWFIYQAVAKKAEKITTKTAGAFGNGLGSGATHTLINEGGSALGSFLGGLLGKGSSSGSHNSDDEEDDEGGYDTSSFRVYDDE
jgi:hypothetical protein